MADPLTALGGTVGAALLAAQWYHNHKIREYAWRQAAALEALVTLQGHGSIPPVSEFPSMIRWVWKKRGKVE